MENNEYIKISHYGGDEDMSFSTGALNCTVTFIVDLYKGNSIRYRETAHLVENATGNCQTACIGYMDGILKVLGLLSLEEKDPKVAGIEFFNLVRAYIGRKHFFKKRLFFIDIREHHLSDVEKYFTVVVKEPYVSTNGSKMVVCLIRIPLSITELQ